jgi:hypothetical protein
MTSNIEVFERKVREFAVKLGAETVVLFHKRLAFDLLARVIAKTPVLTGRARGNWQVTVGVPATGYIGGVDSFLAKAPQQAESAVASSSAYDAGVKQLTGLAPFSIVWISNNVPYINVLEAGRLAMGFGPLVAASKGVPRATGSIQAPEGMLRPTINELLLSF